MKTNRKVGLGEFHLAHRFEHQKTQLIDRILPLGALSPDSHILVQGARPLFFLDYLAARQLQDSTVLTLVEGMAKACPAHGCALLGGETAEMPGTYSPGD